MLSRGIKVLGALWTIALVGLCCGCQQRDALETIQAEGELRVVTRNSPTTYYQDRNGPTGFEYALASLLAEDLGVELIVQSEFNLDAIFRKLRRSETDLAAAGLTLTEKRLGQYPHSDPYYHLTPQVVYVAGTFRPRKPDDLVAMSIAALAGSSHVDTLRALKDSGYDDLSWREIDDADATELLELVASRKVQLALIDSNEFKVLQPLYPRLRVAFELGAEQQLTWFLPPDADNTRLLERINALFGRLEETGEMDKLSKLFFERGQGVTRMGSHTFSRNVRKKLPEYRQLIQQVANEYKLDWELLAAIAYQESHWNPTATSATGVRGMMMLTLPTARELGVENRLDPLESLRGGARYLKNIKRRLPQDITEPDITWFAMAAYNVGMGHLEDARVITQRQGGDPDLWVDVKERLPLLQKSKYYQNARYGYARGSEPVTYVRNIRHYYNILQWQDINENKPSPPVQTDRFLPQIIKTSRLLAL